MTMNGDGNMDTAVVAAIPPPIDYRATKGNRPYNETDDDLSKEAYCILSWQRYHARKKTGLDTTVHKLPRSYEVDYYAAGRVIEVKARTYPRGHFDTFYIGLRKWATGLELAKAMGGDAQFSVIVGWLDAVVIANIDPRRPPPVTVEWRGRTDRGQRGDVEPVVHIPNIRFCPEPLSEYGPYKPHEVEAILEKRFAKRKDGD